LILVDTSAWVDFFNSSSSPASTELTRLIAAAEPLAIPGVVVAEVLQGLNRDVSRIEQYLAQWTVLEPSGFGTYREAAAIFRSARAQGIAVTTIDVLIAAIALEHGATLFTLDKDFSRIASIVRLPLYLF
jgi:predicted nucleic acid-binding protein